MEEKRKKGMKNRSRPKWSVGNFCKNVERMKTTETKERITKSQTLVRKIIKERQTTTTGVKETTTGIITTRERTVTSAKISKTIMLRAQIVPEDTEPTTPATGRTTTTTTGATSSAHRVTVTEKGLQNYVKSAQGQKYSHRTM